MSNTDKLREIAEKYGISSTNTSWIELFPLQQQNLLADLTALISEGYVEKAKYDELLRQRDELLKTMKSIYCTTDASDQTSMQHAIYRIGAAIKNTETNQKTEANNGR